MLSSLLPALATVALGAGPTPVPPPAVLRAAGPSDRPRVNVWLNRDDTYRRGDNARVYFKADRDGYVTVVRIDTDGRMRVLFPIDPWEDNFVRGGKTFEVLGRDRDEAFRIDDYPGVGYIFAISSQDAFNYNDLVRGDHWDYRVIGDGRVRGDPYVAATDFASRIAGEDDYDYDVTEYYVEKRYDYPRFLCYDCHSYAGWSYWDPYSSFCSRFRIVIYNDPYYYPYRYYGPGVVIVRPYRLRPRYVFKDWDGRNDYLTRVAQRPRVAPGDRRPDDGGRTSVDIGGRGSIPVPIEPRRRSGDQPQGSPDAGGGRRPAPRSDLAPADRSIAPAQPQTRTEPRRTAEPQAPDSRQDPRGRPDDSQRRGSPDTAQPNRDPDPQDRPDVSRRRGDPNVAEPDRGADPRDQPDVSRRRGSPDDRDDARGDPSDQDRNVRPDDRGYEPRRGAEPRQGNDRPAPDRSDKGSRNSPPPRSAEPRRESPPPKASPPRSEPELKRRKPGN